MSASYRCDRCRRHIDRHDEHAIELRGLFGVILHDVQHRCGQCVTRADALLDADDRARASRAARQVATPETLTRTARFPRLTVKGSR